jgi:hypothetical protein
MLNINKCIDKDWRIGLKCKPCLISHKLHGQCGIIREVQLNDHGFFSDAIIKIEMESGVIIQESASNWITT